jgi:hypothetical protein
MNAIPTKTSRRAFFVAGGATLGAGLAAAGTTALPAHADPDPSLNPAAEREAIRRLHAAFIAGVESRTHEAAVATHHAYRANGLQHADELSVSGDGQLATATWHVDVQTGALVEGDSTLAQMARLQGQLTDVRWESGTLLATYTRTQGEWRIAALEYHSSRT